MRAILAQTPTQIGVPLVLAIGAITAWHAKYTRTGSTVSAFLGFTLGIFVMKTWGPEFNALVHGVGQMLSSS